MLAISRDPAHHIKNMRDYLVNDDITSCQFYLTDNNIPEPKAKNSEGYKQRLLCKDWWSRTLQRMDNRETEADIIKQGRVSKQREKYASNLAVFRTKKQAAQNAQFMENQSMVSDTGEVVSMQEIIEHSLANPSNRRAELMIRMAGFEMYAQENGFVGEFYTLTTPSKYHRFTGEGLNKKYLHNPKEAQAYLVKMWSKIRAEYGRQNIKPFGFRVAEPHHDGCPHWHMLLFITPEQRQPLRDIMSHYALEIDGDEPGAQQHRFKFVEIDPDQGTATGYIAKYISKNLGFDLDDVNNDQTDKSKEYGQRVKSWAHTWGVRQFQQIGGSPVTVWRELRKIDEPLDDPIMESARQAADDSRWSDFLQIMGGANIRRDEQQVKLLKKNFVNKETGEMKSNKYSEIVETIFGIYTLASEAITKTKNWQMMLTKQAKALQEQGETSGASRGLSCSSWSPVNNCTRH